MFTFDPSHVDPTLDCRAVTFENPTGDRGAGGSTREGRKGAAYRKLAPGERAQLCDLEGPGTVRHAWMTFPPAPPEQMRALWLEAFYDGADEPSISVPCLDFFALPLGRPVPYASALTTAQEGRGFNSYVPMPFRHSLRVEVQNSSQREMDLYFQLDFTKERELAPGAGLLHVPFRRENPTELYRDFVIADGLAGPGRFLGCAVGIRVLDRQPGFLWYGEGEVKVYRDGDTELPTICGTGLEDYVGTAWGMGAHAAPYSGAPLDVRGPGTSTMPDFVSFYRWHVADPIMFERELRVAIQQIGYAFEVDGQPPLGRPHAGPDWVEFPGGQRGLAERVDDYCAAAFVYCTEAQPVPRLDVAAACADIERRPYESPSPFEVLLAANGGTAT